MKNKAIILLGLIFISCKNDRRIYYSKDKRNIVTKIEKFDEKCQCDKVYLARGEYKEGEFPINYISVSNNHLLGGFAGLLSFEDTSKIILYDPVDYFEKVGNDSSFIVVRYENNIDFYKIFDNDSILKEKRYFVIENE